MKELHVRAFSLYIAGRLSGRISDAYYYFQLFQFSSLMDLCPLQLQATQSLLLISVVLCVTFLDYY